MSIARLAGLVARAGAPVGRQRAQEVTPAFDAPAAVEVAAMQAALPTAAAALPPARRFVRPGADAALATAPPRREAAAVPPPRIAEMRPAAPQAQLPSPGERSTTATALPSALHPPSTAEAAPDPTVVASPIVQVPTRQAAPAAPITGQVVFVEQSVGGRPAEARQVTPQAAVTRHAAPEGRPIAVPLPAAARHPASVAEPAPAPAAAAPPSVAIGTVEVVMAPPPQRPIVPPRAAPDRGFGRYAAMRAARDRSW